MIATATTTAPYPGADLSVLELTPHLRAAAVRSRESLPNTLMGGLWIRGAISAEGTRMACALVNAVNRNALPNACWIRTCWSIPYRTPERPDDTGIWARWLQIKAKAHSAPVLVVEGINGECGQCASDPIIW